MEKKYIEVNELLKSFTPDCSVYNSNKPIKIDLRLIKRIITRQPIANVTEVKYGEWVLDEESAKWGFPFICTAKGCGKAHDHREKYCPNCGAKMDGGKIE